ncbi:rubrerythrin family protein [Aneurinibacillus sp. Ricciae_BoGa-3]|uniref:rubrerythrin family protein n=1 Tax=Aneurinibacillus sp. Ricciae_BoGa-3 TaxID=3022697 RepID=UPI002341958E|nr:rubrerythrin family protein [Aneurinibacillus sp. Ricciae_BoGa-3]WCK54941.1 rubrerythrin family protein [Aneurinibacillus sp. Ricciae_BoGa-3]
MSKQLQNTQTLQNLKAAFAGESQANRRYLYFAKQADTEGQSDIANAFRRIGDGETAHANGHFDMLLRFGAGDPVTDLPVGTTENNLKSAIAGEEYEFSEMYPGFAKSAREEGFNEIAEWFEVMAKSEKAHANTFKKILAKLGEEE